jgi:hypothetical protein
MLDGAVLDGEEQCDVMAKVQVFLSLNKLQNIWGMGGMGGMDGMAQQLYSATHSYISELVEELFDFTPPDTSVLQKPPALILIAWVIASQRVWRRDHILPLPGIEA